MKPLRLQFQPMLAHKLIGAIVLALVALAVMSWIAVSGTQRIAEDSRRLFSENIRQLAMARLDHLDGLMARLVPDADGERLEQDRRAFEAISTELNSLRQRAGGLPAEHVALLDGLFAIGERYLAQADKVLQAAGAADRRAAMAEFEEGARADLRAYVDWASGGSQSDTGGSTSHVEADAVSMTMRTVLIAIILIVAVGGGGMYVVLGSVRALDAMAGVTGQLAAGDMHVEIPGGRRRDEIGRMARSLEQIRAVGIKAAQAFSSLNDASSPMMIVNTDGLVTFPNKAMLALEERFGSQFATQLPGFGEGVLTGIRFDDLHNSEAMRSATLMASDDLVTARVGVAGRTFELTASPVYNDQQDRLGALVEWKDLTEQVRVEQEIGEIVNAATQGDFSQRLSEADKSGFMADLANGMNELLDVVDHGLAQVIRLMSGLASGDLTMRMKGEHKGAYAMLKSDADRMCEQTEQMIGQIATVSAAMKSATDEISTGIGDLSVRTEHQASSLEETASAMRQLSDTVRKNADNAQEASRIASTARDAAVSGGRVAKQAVTAMEGIEGSSQRIAEIIGLIQEIAFQTNLLALNAAIEAARAGESGRGFAVVAGEVRALAQRATAASKDIKDLITTSSSEVEKGARLVNEAGTALEDIVGSVRQVADHVSDIATASRDQTGGIDQVSVAMAEMDGMTRQNAALVEESNASIAATTRQADALLQTVGFFRTSDAVLQEQAEDGQAPQQAGAKRSGGAGPTDGNAALAINLDEDDDSFVLF